MLDSTPSTAGTDAAVQIIHPNLRPWQKGQSGNPAGRRAEQTLKQLASLHTEKALLKIVALIDSSDERVAIMAAKEVLDRACGKAKPMEDADDANQKALTINIVRYTDGNQPPERLDAPTVSIRTLAVPGERG